MGRQLGSAVLPRKCWAPLCWGESNRLVPNLGQTLGSKAAKPVCPGERVFPAPVPMLQALPPRLATPKPWAPSFSHTNYSSMWNIHCSKKHFCSCRSGFPPGGGSQSIILNQSWMRLRQSKAGALSQGTAGRVPSSVTGTKNAPLLIAGGATQQASGHSLKRRHFGSL